MKVFPAPASSAIKRRKLVLDRVELLRGWLLSAMDRGKIPADASSDPSGGVLNGIAGEVSVPISCLHLRVTQELPDHRKAFAERQCPRGIRIVPL